MRRAKALLVVLAATASFALAGCQQVAQKAIESTTGVSVDQKGDSVNIKGSNGETINFNSQMPAELKDFPMPAGFKLDSSGSMSSGGDKLAVASYKGKGALQQVTEFYQKNLPGLGWKEDGTMMTDTGGLLSYASTKNTTDSLTLTISKGDADAIEVSVLFGKNKNTPVAKATSAPTVAANSGGAGATPTAKSGAQPTEKPAATETPAPPKTADSAAIPAELKALPIPAGFAPIKDGMLRLTEGGKFKSAVANYVGKPSVIDAGAAVQAAFASKGWTEDEFAAGEDEAGGSFTNPTDNSSVTILITKQDTGTQIYVQLLAGQQ